MKKKRVDADSKFFKSLARYLKRHGWLCVVVGNCQIEQRSEDQKFIYHVVFKIVGKKIVEK